MVWKKEKFVCFVKRKYKKFVRKSKEKVENYLLNWNIYKQKKEISQLRKLTSDGFVVASEQLSGNYG